MAPSRQHSAGHSERWYKTAQWRQVRVLKTHQAGKASGQQTHRGIPMGAFKTLAFFLIESNFRWTLDRINASPCLQRNLDTLSSGEYFGNGYQVVATNESLRLNRSSTKEPAMGAGVMWHDATIPHRSERVGGQHSSTRADLATVVMALKGSPRAESLAILIALSTQWGPKAHTLVHCLLSGGPEAHTFF